MSEMQSISEHAQKSKGFLTSGWAAQQYVIGIMCAQKPPKWNFECQKPLRMFALTTTCYPSLMGGFWQNENIIIKKLKSKCL